MLGFLFINFFFLIDLYGIQFIAPVINTYRNHYSSSYKHQSSIDTIIFINCECTNYKF